MAKYVVFVRGWVAPFFVCVALSACNNSKEPAAPANSGQPGAPPPNAAATGAFIRATPNPVPASTELLGTTTITWDTGNGGLGEVYTIIPGGEEKKFDGPKANGSQAAPWIGKAKHEFRLYEGTDHKKVLASVTVTKEKK